MFLLARPTSGRIAAFRREQAALPFAYEHVGSTRGERPEGMTRDENRVVLGRGEEVWTRARESIRAWRMFDLGWIEIHERTAPIAVGTTVAILVRAVGSWSLNAARVAYVVDERERFGFGYATLPEHVECGEERFVVLRGADGTVDYEIVADSRPSHVLARIGHPLARALQKRFARESLAAMRRAAGKA